MTLSPISNLFDLGYDKWYFYDVPQTESGFYDLHNSYLTIIVRDSYLGLFKIFMWISQILILPFGAFIGISLRASHDTFLLGGVNDLLVLCADRQVLNNVLKRLRTNI